MRVTFYGMRGSVPTPGPSTVRYGGNSACVAVRLEDDSLIILDGETGIRVLGQQLRRDGHVGRTHLFISHPHWDHIIGLPFFGPIYRRETQMSLYSFGLRWQARSGRPALFDGEHFPAQLAELAAQIQIVEPAGDEVWVGAARVRRVRLNHPGGSDGFRIDDADGSSLCYLTDNELAPPTMPTVSPVELARFAHGTGLLIHVALYHHEPERDDDALDQIGKNATKWAATHAAGMVPIVACEGRTITVTPRGGVADDALTPAQPVSTPDATPVMSE